MFALLALGWRAAAADFFTPTATNSTSRVVIAEGNDLLNAFLPDDVRVAAVFNLGLTRFTHTTNVIAAWRSLVATNDTIGIKVFFPTRPAQRHAARRRRRHCARIARRRFITG